MGIKIKKFTVRENKNKNRKYKILGVVNRTSYMV